MKKPLLAILMVWYLALTSGVAISFHYCMNRLDSTTVFAAASDVCGKCGMHTADAEGCCREEVKIVKIEDDQQLTSLLNFTFSGPALVPLMSAFLTDAASSDKAIALQEPDGDPPPATGPDIYLANCVFRI